MRERSLYGMTSLSGLKIFRHQPIVASLSLPYTTSVATRTFHRISNMGHDNVWFSRPRRYGKGSRQWFVHFQNLHKVTEMTEMTSLEASRVLLTSRPIYFPNLTAVSALTKPVWSASTISTSAVSASASTLVTLASRRYVYATENSSW